MKAADVSNIHENEYFRIQITTKSQKTHQQTIERPAVARPQERGGKPCHTRVLLHVGPALLCHLSLGWVPAQVVLVRGHDLELLEALVQVVVQLVVQLVGPGRVGAGQAAGAGGGGQVRGTTLLRSVHLVRKTIRCSYSLPCASCSTQVGTLGHLLVINHATYVLTTMPVLHWSH